MEADIFSIPLALLAETYFISAYLRRGISNQRAFRQIYLPFTFLTYLVLIGTPSYGEYHFTWLRNLPDWYHILTAELIILLVEVVFVAWLIGLNNIKSEIKTSILKVFAAVFLGNVLSLLGGEIIAQAISLL